MDNPAGAAYLGEATCPGPGPDPRREGPPSGTSGYEATNPRSGTSNFEATRADRAIGRGRASVCQYEIASPRTGCRGGGQNEPGIPRLPGSPGWHRRRWLDWSASPTRRRRGQRVSRRYEPSGPFRTRNSARNRSATPRSVSSKGLRARMRRAKKELKKVKPGRQKRPQHLHAGRVVQGAVLQVPFLLKLTKALVLDPPSGRVDLPHHPGARLGCFRRTSFAARGFFPFAGGRGEPISSEKGREAPARYSGGPSGVKPLIEAPALPAQVLPSLRWGLFPASPDPGACGRVPELGGTGGEGATRPPSPWPSRMFSLPHRPACAAGTGRPAGAGLPVPPRFGLPQALPPRTRHPPG